MFTIGVGKKILSVRNPMHFDPMLNRRLVMQREYLLRKPLEAAIREKLISSLNPAHLEIINESYKHNVPRGSETHFRVIIVTEKFENMPLLQRHRMVNDLLKYELDNGVHALSIVAKTPDQWIGDGEDLPSPTCMGGNN